MATAIASRGSKNRLVVTEDFTHATWATTGTGSRTANAVANPLNTGTTADLLTDSGAGDQYLVRQDYTVPSLSSWEMDYHTASVWVRTSTATATRLSLYYTGASAPRVDLDITWSSGNPTITRTLTNVPASSFTAVDVRTDATWIAGWHRFSIVLRHSVGAGALRFEIAPAGSSAAATGAVWVWGAQLEQNQTMTSYNAVTAATDPLAGTYRTIEAWLAATNGVLSSVEVLQLRDEVYEVTNNTLIFANTSTTQTNHRRIEPVSAAYDPATNTGPKIIVRGWASNATASPVINAGIKIQENFCTIDGVGLFSDYSTKAGASSTGTLEHRLIWIDSADNCRIQNCFLRADRGASDGTALVFFTGIYIEGTSVAKALYNNIFNTIVVGDSPYSQRGLGSGPCFFWGNFAERGGAWGCIAYGGANGFQSLGKEVVVGKTAAYNAPSFYNCISVENQGFTGSFKHFKNNISGNLTAATTQVESDQVDTQLQPAADPGSKVFMTAAALFWSAEHQDFRPRPGSALIGAGVDRTTDYTDADTTAPTDPDEGGWGPGVAKDRTGVTRTGTWTIGPYASAAEPAGLTFTIVTKTIGRDRTRDYGSVAAFFQALPKSLYNVQQRWVGVCYADGADEEIGTTLQVDTFDCITGPQAYVEVKGATNFDIRANVGYSIDFNPATTSIIRHRSNLWISMPFFKLTGIKLHQQATSAEGKNCRCIELFSNSSIVDSCYFLLDGSSIRFLNTAFEVEGNGNTVQNCIARGAATTGQGAARGFTVTRGSQRNRLLHCDAYRIKGGSTGGGTAAGSAGFLIATATSFTRVTGCIAVETATLNGTSAKDFEFGAGITGALVMDHSISSDTTAVGAGSFVSQTAASIWKNAPLGDFRLAVGSAASNKGTNLTDVFGLDQAGQPRLVPYDIGAREGVASPPLFGSPRPKDHHRHCTLWQIIRQDGVVHQFTSANEPVVFQGLTYTPINSVGASAVRREAALKEQNLELVGAISSPDITATALAAGLYRNARVVRMVIDWRYPWTTPYRHDVYRLPRVDFDSESWTAELVGPTILLDQRVGEVITVSCPYKLGSPDCQLDLTPYIEINITIASVVTARREFTCVISASRANDFFGLGDVTFYTGANAGLVFDIKSSTLVSGTTQRIKLMQKAPFDLVAGDQFDLKPGCRRRYVADCITKWNNGINFGGRPFIGGTDKALTTPTR